MYNAKFKQYSGVDIPVCSVWFLCLSEKKTEQIGNTQKNVDSDAVLRYSPVYTIVLWNMSSPNH